MAVAKDVRTRTWEGCQRHTTVMRAVEQVTLRLQQASLRCRHPKPATGICSRGDSRVKVEFTKKGRSMRRPPSLETKAVACYLSTVCSHRGPSSWSAKIHLAGARSVIAAGLRPSPLMRD
jgi:hypothetical protein